MIGPNRVRHSTNAAAARVRINLSWLVKLRWAGVSGQLATITVVSLGFGLDLPLAPLGALVAVGAATNGLLELWQRWAAKRLEAETWSANGRAWIGSITLLDVLLLSGLLYFSGGAGNPFAVFYFVNLVLAMVVLGGLWMRVLNAVALTGFTALVFVHEPLDIGGPLLLVENSDGEAALTTYAKGLLVAFAAVIAFSAYFVRRLTDELAARERDLEAERARQADSERVQALATLAAGAAHELSTPLSTIAVVARELERVLERSSAAQDAVEDARLIRTEVTRCRTILDQMSLDAGSAVGEELVVMSPGELLQNALRNLRGAERVRWHVADSLAEAGIAVPRVATARALRGLMKNALEASESEGQVAVSVEKRGEAVAFCVVDAGTGMDPDVLARAGDPFFTTKDPGRGMGLGLFLARSLAERLGGSLTLESGRERGTIATLVLPLKANLGAAGPG